MGRVCPAASGSVLLRVLIQCAAGALPQPVACSACDAGVWIEFEPVWPAPSASSASAPMQVRDLTRDQGIRTKMPGLACRDQHMPEASLVL